MRESAPAKVNLFLHVGPPGSDGYHPLSSLVTFADVGDSVELRWAREMSFSTEGPFAGALGDPADNLALRARDLALTELGTHARSFRLRLEKHLPIASGLGGGSADAAAVLRLLAQAFGLAGPARGRLADAAARLGADLAMCLASRAALAHGRGETLADPPQFADLNAVLANPLVESPTSAVYRAYDAAGTQGGAEPPVMPARLSSAEEMAAFLGECRNDLEAPAVTLVPAIGDALAALRAQPSTLIARMSGSGATCFAICESGVDATRTAAKLAADHPSWWIRACRLAGSGQP